MIPRLCSGGTVLCIASGPSLTQADVDLCRGKVDASIAINNSHEKAPWATALYACDAVWWRDHPEAESFAGLKYGLQRERNRLPPYVTPIPYTGDVGLELDPSAIRHGKNSGYQAINVAVHFGAKRILLIGYDMGLGPKGETHWHRTHRRGVISPYASWLSYFQTLVEPLKAHGVEVLNCSRRTQLTAFPRVSLEDALVRVAA